MTGISHFLTVSTRPELGREVRKLRRAGIVPANIYGKGAKSVAVSAKLTELRQVLDEAGESALVEINLDGKEKFPVLFKNPTLDPISEEITHLEMYKVNMKEKITAVVPLVLTGEALAIKQGLLLVEITGEVELECLPSDLPEKIEVDVTKLEKLNDMITIGDLNLDKSKIEIKSDLGLVIVKVEEAVQAEVVEEVAPAPGEVPATEQKTAEELAAAEGAEKEEKAKDSKTE